MSRKYQVNDQVEYIDPETGKSGIARVAEVNDKGQATKIELPEGEIIEAVGLILTIIRSVQKFLLIIGSIFSKKAKARLKALRKTKANGK